jgi:hypothetical protein
MVTERKIREQEVQIARYRLLERKSLIHLPQAYCTSSSWNLRLTFRRIASTEYQSAAPVSVCKSAPA